jgi:hypothetical protein
MRNCIRRLHVVGIATLLMLTVGLAESRVDAYKDWIA